MPPPELDEPSLIALLRVKTPAFIKWDARPGNAIVNKNGTITWFDWEHCGCRSPWTTWRGCYAMNGRPTIKYGETTV